MERIKTPDAKNRISLGRLAEGVEGFRMTIDEDHRIILEPIAMIPAREAWLFRNKEALASVASAVDRARRHEFVDSPVRPEDDEWISQLDD